jgi:hypothetical protein
MNATTTRSSKLALTLLSCAAAFAVQSASAVLVTWDLNPTNANASVGSSSQTFTSSGYSLTAYGFDQVSGPDTGHTLYYKNSGIDHGLGLVGTPNNELQVNSDHTLPHYIQFDLTSLLLQGFTNGQIKISSVDPGEAWDIYGSNTLGELGTKLNGAAFGDSTNNTFVNVPNFGSFKYISVGANIDDVLPWSFQATIVPIPEAVSIVPVLLLVTVATAFEARRRRRVTA